MILAVVTACTVSMSFTVSAVRPPKVKKPKAIDWNNSYYSEKFDHCKKLRMFNPVELVRAQAWATGVFRKCGPSLVVKYGSKYAVPAYGKNFGVFGEKK